MMVSASPISKPNNCWGLRERFEGGRISGLMDDTARLRNARAPLDLRPRGGGLFQTGKTIMIKKLGVLILAATLLAGCYPFASPPQQQTTQQTTTTTTTSCPAGTQLQSDGMCR
jgi:hypothetical protein